MLKLIVLCILVAYIAAYTLNETRIIKGTKAKPGEIPYIVSLRNYNSHSCGGSILDKRHILTAAHCISGSSPSTWSVQYGVLNIKSNENIIPVEAIYRHEGYSAADKYANDIAVLKLSSDIVYGQNAQPVVLPEKDEKPPGGNTAVFAGWGIKRWGLFPDHLQRVDIILYTDENCKAAHGSRVDVEYKLCAGVPEGGKGNCNLDSGGPLYSNGKQWGVLSWMWVLVPCASKGYPGVYTRVPSYIDWIKEKQLL